MYTETFTFSFGHYCLDSFVFPPFIFKSFYQVGTAVCRSCGCVTTNIWEMSRSLTGVGWELGVLASIHTTNMPLHSPPHIPFAPSVPISTPEPSYLTDILDLYWGYLGRILTISLPYILGLSHFLNTFNTLSQLVHHTCTTFWLHLPNSNLK